MKKKFLKGLFSVVMAGAMTLGIAACGGGGDADSEDGSGATGTVSLSLWTPITGADLTVFNRMITRFNQA